MVESSEEVRKAIKLLKENGYVVKKLNKYQIEDAKKCDEYDAKGKDMDCNLCSCNCCIML